MEDYMSSLERSKEKMRQENDRLRSEQKSNASSINNAGRKQFVFTNPNNTSTSTSSSNFNSGANRYMISKPNNLNTSTT